MGVVGATDPIALVWIHEFAVLAVLICFASSTLLCLSSKREQDRVTFGISLAFLAGGPLNADVPYVRSMVHGPVKKLAFYGRCAVNISSAGLRVLIVWPPGPMRACVYGGREMCFRLAHRGRGTGVKPPPCKQQLRLA